MIQEYGVTYPKLLLFGEYGILLGGSALTIPLKIFSARFDFLGDALDVEMARSSNRFLASFAEYLEKDVFVNEQVDIRALKMDVQDGLFLSSDIPMGYGLGSSGVVCAAILKTYGTVSKSLVEASEHLLFYKNLFSFMEAYFHGKSSGLDPLACFLGKPIIAEQNKISVLPALNLIEGSWFLLDSGISRKTDKLVDAFLSKCYSSEFRNQFENNYNVLVNEVISKLKDKSGDLSMETYMEAISLLQLTYFSEMIPEFLVPVWQQGLDTGCFYLKLLGAGGGGFYLGLSTKKATTGEVMAAYGYNIHWLTF